MGIIEQNLETNTLLTHNNALEKILSTEMKQRGNGKYNYTRREMCQPGCELSRHAVSLLWNEQFL